jgi:hypothetical protein
MTLLVPWFPPSPLTFPLPEVLFTLSDNIVAIPHSYAEELYQQLQYDLNIAIIINVAITDPITLMISRILPQFLLLLLLFIQSIVLSLMILMIFTILLFITIIHYVTYHYKRYHCHLCYYDFLCYE